MTAIATRTLGRTGIALTELGFGAGPLGGFYGPVTPDEATQTVRAAWEAGVRYFDVAPLYGHGRAEVLLGHVLRELPRDEFVLSTKVGRWLRPQGLGEDPATLAARRAAVPSGARLLARRRAAFARAFDAAARRAARGHRDDPRRRRALAGSGGGGRARVHRGDRGRVSRARRAEARGRDPRDRHRAQPGALGAALDGRRRPRLRDDRRALHAAQPRGGERSYSPSASGAASACSRPARSTAG